MIYIYININNIKYITYVHMEKFRHHMTWYNDVAWNLCHNGRGKHKKATTWHKQPFANTPPLSSTTVSQDEKIQAPTWRCAFWKLCTKMVAICSTHLGIFTCIFSQLKQIIKRKDWDDGLRISPKKLLSSTSIFAGGRVLSSRIPIEGLSTLGTIVSHSNKSNLQLSNVRHQ